MKERKPRPPRYPLSLSEDDVRALRWALLIAVPLAQKRNGQVPLRGQWPGDGEKLNKVLGAIFKKVQRYWENMEGWHEGEIYE